MENVVFTPLPIPDLRIIIRQEVENVVKEFINNEASESDKWFDIDELCDYLPGKPTKATIYRWAKQGKLPAKKYGSRLAFLKSEIDQWLKEKNRNPVEELDGKDCLK